jgi:hypothetical protein
LAAPHQEDRSEASAAAEVHQSLDISMNLSRRERNRPRVGAESAFALIVVRPSRVHRGRRDACTTKKDTARVDGSHTLKWTSRYWFGGKAIEQEQTEGTELPSSVSVISVISCSNFRPQPKYGKTADCTDDTDTDRFIRVIILTPNEIL